MKYLLVFLIPLLGFGCTSTPKRDKAWCNEADWYEVGRQDGIKGLAKQSFNKHHKVCDPNDFGLNRKLYESGYNAGLARHCSPVNAFELGKRGSAYPEVCPKALDSEARKSFLRGKRTARRGN